MSAADPHSSPSGCSAGITVPSRFFKLLPRAKNTVDVPSPRAGYVREIVCRDMGVACVILGGGREKKEDTVDPAVGYIVHKKLGDAVKQGEALCTIHYNSDARLGEARGLIERAYGIGDAPPEKLPPLVHKILQ